MIRIYGASDDLIEVEGDISEEFNHYSDDPALLGFSDGTMLRVTYDNDGIWRFTPVLTGRARLVHVIQTLDDPDDGYSDSVYLYDEELPEDQKIRWVLLGEQYETRRR